MYEARRTRGWFFLHVSFLLWAAGFGHEPERVEALGETGKTESELVAFLASVSQDWTQASYDLWRHNCNDFSELVSTFLLGSSIPEWIRKLPARVLATPLGQLRKTRASALQRYVCLQDTNPRRLSPMLGTATQGFNAQLQRHGGLIAAAPPTAAQPTMRVTIKAARTTGALEKTKYAPQRRRARRIYTRHHLRRAARTLPWRSCSPWTRRSARCAQRSASTARRDSSTRARPSARGSRFGQSRRGVRDASLEISDVTRWLDR